MTRPNVLLVVFDTARADAFEPYGAPPGASPVVADMAARGGWARLAYAPASWTVPSHVSMFTGRLPRAVGLGQAPGGTYASTRPEMERLSDVLLPSVLRQHGYRTAGASSNAWISPTGGWDMGFDEFTHVPSRRVRPRGRGSQRTLRWLHQSVLAEIDDGARQTTALLRDWFDRWNGRTPFFWFVNLVECHAPYAPPRPYNDLSPWKRVLAARDNHRYQTFTAVLRQNLSGLEAPPSALDRMRHLYARSIRLLDDWLGGVMDLLSEHGVLEDTAVIMTSDHGENFGEGERIGHSMSLDERLVRVPFVTRGPISAPADGTWSTVGLPALVGSAVGVRPSPWESFPTGTPVPLQFDPLAPEDDQRVRDLRTRWNLTDAAVGRLARPLTGVSDGRYKLIQHGDERYAHDLRADPLEVLPRDADDAPRHLHEALNEPGMWARPQEWPSASADVRDEGHVDDVAALEEQMRLLGYM